MKTTDRTTKLLLAAIVVLLGLLAVRPMLPMTSSAVAQQAVPIADDNVDLGFRVPQPSVIVVPEGQFVREIQVIDSAQAFLVRYDNRIEVYRVQVMQMSQDEVRRRLQQRR
jgi:hypothetical protein